VFVGLSVHNRDETRQLVRRLREAGLETLDLSDNEMAKLHIRHMVGGRSSQVRDEMVYRFEFPERPGALMHFLTRMTRGWNISLFHYRNHGADFGRVLVGIQVPDTDKRAFRSFLKRLNYRYWDESDNLAYELFLGRNP
jgi:threonine dehydratase